MRKSLSPLSCLLAVLAITLWTANSARSKSPPLKNAKELPSWVPQIGELGENIYDLAKDKDWPKAADKLAAINETVNVTAGNAAIEREEKTRLDECIADIDKAVKAKDRHAAMRGSNQLTLIAARLTEPFDVKVPVDVTRLDYYGRELEIWAAAEDMERLNVTAKQLRKTWNRLRPTFVNNTGVADVKQFEKFVNQVEAASSPRDYSLAAANILEGVDKLEKVFDSK